MSTSILLFSSWIFMTNAITAYYKNYPIYSALFILVTITSLMYHSSKDIYTYALDILAVCSVVLYGTFLLRNNLTTHNYIYQIIIFCIILSLAYLFFYGYIKNKYCYDADKTTSEKYHCLLHILSSTLLHFIIFL